MTRSRRSAKTTTTVIEFAVPGRAVPQGSKRHVGRGILIESAKNLQSWRERVALAAHNAMRKQPLLAGAVTVEILFILYRPVSTPKRSTPPATKKPDIDKLARAILDAITDTVITTDSQVVELYAHKRLAEVDEAPAVLIRIETL